MNRRVLFRLVGIGLILMTLSWLVACQPEEVEPAASEAVISEEAAETVLVNPADQKFYSGVYVARPVAVPEVDLAAGINPADRKFFSGAYGANIDISAAAAVPANIHPADRKFFNQR